MEFHKQGGRALAATLAFTALLLTGTAAAQGNQSSCSLDVDGNGENNALTDGLLFYRYMSGFTGTTLTGGAVDQASCTRCTGQEIVDYLDTPACQILFDADGDGERIAVTDGVLVLRYLFGFTDTTLTAGAVNEKGCTRCNADEIIAHIETPVLVNIYPINDTGITRCADAGTNSLDCPVSGFPLQDAEVGRDVEFREDSDGHAGFSYTKLAANGDPLPASAEGWSCVRDNVTGLVWEVKTEDGGLHDRDNFFTWYDPDPTTNGGEAGLPDGGDCSGEIVCDTEALAQATNAEGLCGASNWRLPSYNELLSIMTADRVNPTVDTDYFPNTNIDAYWSSATSPQNPIGVFTLDFGAGGSFVNSKDLFGYPARLVHDAP